MKKQLEINIKGISEAIYKNAVEKGFHTKEKLNNIYAVPARIMLIVSELAEAMEADRLDMRSRPKAAKQVMELKSDAAFKAAFEMYIKDTVEDELADAAIRIFDLAEVLKSDLGSHILAKHRYNGLRPKMHGGKKY